VKKDVWTSRGYLPHIDAIGRVQMITLRLVDSLPQAVLQRLIADCDSVPEARRDTERRKALERALDRGYGECWLRKPEIARLVERRLQETDGEECLLYAWTIMPNHLHALVEVADETELWRLIRSWKGPTARQANQMLRRRGSFWFREYHDRYVRTADHFVAALRYIDENPVRAGLCRTSDEWPFGSARFRSASEWAG
jgi:REP element-mobilizing transposase RayT